MSDDFDEVWLQLRVNIEGRMGNGGGKKDKVIVMVVLVVIMQYK